MLLNACVLVKVVPTKAWIILKGIRAMKSVRKAYPTFGRFDIIAFLEAEDYKVLKKMTSQINSIEGVRSTETLAEA